MPNVAPGHALGGWVCGSLDRLGSALGPAVRYRRWLPPSGSLDLAEGTPLVTTTTDLQPGSVFGLVRWSANDWFPLAAPPELLRRTAVLGSRPPLLPSDVQARGRVSL